MVLVQSIPWSADLPADARAWWNYLKRPPVLMEEADYLRTHAVLAQGISYVQTFIRPVSSRQQQLRSVVITAASEDWFRLFDYPLQQGRSFTPEESRRGACWRRICFQGGGPWVRLCVWEESRSRSLASLLHKGKV